MIRFSAFFLAFILFAAVTHSSGPATALTLSEKASIQAAMQRHVDGSLVDGAILYLNPKDGEVHKLHPVTAHPMILSMGAHYVLCFDFRDDTGKEVPIDYYMARTSNDYVVFHTAIADRGLLQRLMKDGTVKRLR
ncbi:hypothetical protein NUH88_13850 [Nisaea acidiphila]|uniref:Uncharacterized protein n=1 Tax=Nisaea acidiphila TaxID=1862145 RepID=A0A9J7ALG4_9PROT|nr:hypothetical protein [Nisaea acidiphila]UUX48491.1 hypothetical protein NUH88_13850 [Nisaea acidiphila]